MIAFASLFLILLILLIVHRISSTLLELTGLSRDAARFQALSALTGTGFTTAESELLVGHHIRRRIAMVLMLVGNTGVVTAIGSVVVSVLEIRGEAKVGSLLFVAVAGIGCLLFFAYNGAFNRLLARLVVLLSRRWRHPEILDYSSLLQVGRGYIVGRHLMDGGEWFANQRLAESRLRTAGLVLLGIFKPDGRFIGTPDGESRPETGDVVIMYGKVEDLERMHERIRVSPQPH